MPSSWHVQEESAAAAAQQLSDLRAVMSDLDKCELSLLKVCLFFLILFKNCFLFNFVF